MFKLGLTGSIGMGKSTTAKMFEDAGCAVWDADAAVHRLYAENGLAVAPLRAAFPEAVRDGSVSRETLKQLIASDKSVLEVIESIVHPLVRQDRELFAQNTERDILVFDIPLLFETGSEHEFDAVACVLVDSDTQRARVMERGTMTLEQFEMIKSKQMPAEEKAERADFVIQTDTLEHAREQVQTVVERIREYIANA